MARTYSFICAVVATVDYCFVLPRAPLAMAKSCPDTYFEYNDSCVPCACQNSAKLCEQATEVCTGWCRTGLQGPGCQQACPTGKFGQNCEEICPCPTSCMSCYNVSRSCECFPADASTDVPVKDKYQISSLTSLQAVMGLMLGYSCFMAVFNIALYFLWVRNSTKVGPE